MVSTCKHPLKRRNGKQAKDAERLGPKREWRWQGSCSLSPREQPASRRKGGTFPTLAEERNVVSPYFSWQQESNPQGKPTGMWVQEDGPTLQIGSSWPLLALHLGIPAMHPL